MSEEEKKAIDFTKYLVNDYKKQLELIGKGNKNYGYSDEEIDVIKYRNEQFEILLNLIEKQQKEIEKYEKQHQDLVSVNKRIYNVEVIDNMITELTNSISKDKIKDEIRKAKSDYELFLDDYFKIKQKVLEELLEEK